MGKNGKGEMAAGEEIGVGGSENDVHGSMSGVGVVVVDGRERRCETARQYGVPAR